MSLKEVNELLSGMMRDMRRTDLIRDEAAALADPIKYKTIRTFRNPMNYCYYETKNGRGSKVRGCYSVHTNVAGYFLIWREIETKRTVKRDRYDATKFKSCAISAAKAIRDAATS